MSFIISAEQLAETCRAAVPRVILKKIRQTCFACPSQWDAWTEDGTYVYLRFRWGCGTVHMDGSLIAEFATDDPYDGVISLQEFLDKTPSIVLDDNWEYVPEEEVECF